MDWHIIGSLVFLAPFVSLIFLSILAISPMKKNEAIVKRTVVYGQVICLFSTIYMAMVFLRQSLLSDSVVPVQVIHWHMFSLGNHKVNFALMLDSLSIWFVIMASILSNVVGVFSENYLHSDEGFFRFFFLITLFFNGILILFMGADFQVTFIGWEIVGLTSALLISFFNVRRETVDNALHAFWAYRISDIGLLTTSILLSSLLPHYMFGISEIKKVLPEQFMILVPLLLLFSAMGKSAQYPFSSWLPKAMEGPTSSSAIFYGGLSIHAGVYLLLRLCMEFEVPFIAKMAFCLLGAISAVYGALLTQIQSDIKSALAYASLSQVGVMFIEIGLGFYHLAIFHCLGHAFLRTYQILKSASIIHEFIDFSDSHRGGAPITMQYQPTASIFRVLFPKRIKDKIFSMAFDLALKDTWGPSNLILLLERLSYKFSKTEERWLRFISNEKVEETEVF